MRQCESSLTIQLGLESIECVSICHILLLYLPTLGNHRNGPSEFLITGSLKDWSAIHLLDKIRVDTLLLNGGQDEVTDASMQPFYENLQRVQWTTFRNSSHCIHLEEEEKFLNVLGSFLQSSTEDANSVYRKERRFV